VDDTVARRKVELGADGHKVMKVASGGTHPDGFIGQAETSGEILLAVGQVGGELDFIHHTFGTVLPGMLPTKLSPGHPPKFRSISITEYDHC